MDKVYCYPDSDVLENKLNIRNENRLLEAEIKLVSIRLYQLQCILIVCFCLDENVCHRSLVREIVNEMSMFYVLVAGSRTFNDYDMMLQQLDHLLQHHAPNVVIVSGGAKGADSLAEHYANEKGYRNHIMPAQWDLYGKSAGYRRNEEMHQYIARFPNRGVVCFWDGESRGTAHNFELCKQYDSPLRIVQF